MLIKRFEDAEPYEAPNHWGVGGLRLQGFEDGGPTNQWVGFSQFLPGGGAGPDATPFEKVYVVLDGEMTIAEECRGTGAEVLEINERPTSAEICSDMVAKAVDAFGALDILVVASGMNKVAKIDEMPPDTFNAVMDANVTQSWLMSRAATVQMKAQGKGGKIVLVSSARGLLGHPAGYTAYCASKAAVDGITKALGCELGSTGITVNAIAPTVFRSPLTAWMFEDTDEAKAVRQGFLTRVPKGRLGEPEDLAGPLLFLASAASDFYTGHILYADGGYTAG